MIDEYVQNENDSQSKSLPKKRRLFAMTVFALVVVLALVVIIVRRQKHIRHLPADGDGKFNRLHEESEDDMDLYIKPTQNTAYSDDNKITPTHGSRVPLD